MGKFNELLAARFNDGPSAVLGLAEQEGIRTVSPELMPVYVVESEKPEHAFTKNEKLGGGHDVAAVDAANVTGIQLLNPVGSGGIVILEAFRGNDLGGAAGTVDLYLVAPAGGPLSTNNGVGVRRDGRWTARLTFAQIRNGIFVPATGDFLTRARILAGTDTGLIPYQVVLPPGWNVVMTRGVINAGLDGSFVYRERNATAEELAA